MRKVLLSLLVLALACPALAAVNIVPVDNGDGTVTLKIETTGGEKVRGVALKVVATGGAELVETVATVNPAFNTYIDYLQTWGVAEVAGETPDQEGHPFADADNAGVVEAGVTEFSISMGVLDPTGAREGYEAPVAGADLITFKTGEGNVCIMLDTLRGGIVGDDVVVTNLDGGASVCVDVTSGEQEAIKATAPFYADWVAFGKPDCWAYARNCRGDADGIAEFGGAVPVLSGDLAIFVAAYGQPTASLPANGICADFDRTGEFGGAVRVLTGDLAIFVQYYGQPLANVPECDMEHYNFWITP